MKIAKMMHLSLLLSLGISFLAETCSPVCAQDRTHSSDNEMLYSDETIVTTASKTALHVADVPAAVSVITEDLINASGATTIPDLLRSVPGVDVMEQNSSQSNVSIRGFNTVYAARLLVMVDGRTIFDDLGGDVSWYTVPVLITRIKRIEIVRGPGSALYGANAFDGVINIITKTPEEIATENRAGQAVASRGSRNSVFAEALTHVSPSKDWAMMVDGGYHQTNGMGDKKAGQVQDGWSTSIFSLDVQKRFSQGAFRLNVDTANSVQNVSTSTVVIPNLHTITQDAVLTYNEDHANVASLARFFINTSLSHGLLAGDLKTYDLEMQQRSLSGNQNVIYGGNYRLLNIKTNLTGSDRHRQTLWSLYSQDDIGLAAQTHLFAGFRYDHNSLYGAAVSPHISLVHHLAHSQTARLSYGTAFRPPTLTNSYIDLFSTVSPDVVVHTLGNLHLKSEEITSLEAGYRWDLRSGNIGINLFDNHLSKLFQYTVMPSTTPDGVYTNTSVNASTARATGFELDSDFTVTPRFNVSLNYSYQNVIDGSGKPVALSPHNKINVTLDRRLTSCLSATVIGHYVDKSIDYSTITGMSAPVGSYLRVDGRLGYRMGSAQHPITIAVAATNLFDDQHLEDIQETQSWQTPIVAPQRRTVWISLDGSF